MPTKSDVAAHEKHLKGVKAAAKLFHTDLAEIRAVIASFGGPSDTMIFGAEAMLKTLKERAD